jgi:hypothetical protein
VSTKPVTFVANVIDTAKRQKNLKHQKTGRMKMQAKENLIQEKTWI